MATRFTDRTYKPRLITNAKTKASSLNRSDLLIKKRRQPNSQSRPYFVTQYSTTSNHIKRLIRENWSIIESDPTLQPIFPEPPIFSFRRAPTLKDKLVHSQITPAKKETWLRKPTGVFKCMHCPHCDNVLPCKSFIDFKTQRKYIIKDFINCSSDHIVYRISCSCPGIFYIGRTKRRLRDRLAEHKYAIRTKNFDYPIARHFAEVHNSNDSALRIIGIEHIKPLIRGGDRIKKLNQRESFWIHQLDALIFLGLMNRLNICVFYNIACVVTHSPYFLIAPYGAVMLPARHHPALSRNIVVMVLLAHTKASQPVAPPTWAYYTGTPSMHISLLPSLTPF